MPTNASFRATLFLLASLMGGLHADQNAPLFGWTPSGDCHFLLSGAGCNLVSTGVDPYIQTRDLPPSEGLLHVEVTLKSNSKGLGQIYYAGGADAGVYSVKRVVNFGMIHDSQWHRYVIYLPAEKLTGLRLDPSMAPGEIGLGTLRLADFTGRVLKEWVFGTSGPELDYPNSAGNAQIYSVFKDSPIVITTTSRLAGAIHSLRWRGREFIDSVDHGRQLQSATNLDCCTSMTAESYNPTEAGSRDDGAGCTSTSRLLSLTAKGPELHSITQMAFWLQPGEKSGLHPAKNTSVLSNHKIEKTVHIGHGTLANVIEYNIVLPMPPDEHHNSTTIEALTGYMPYDFLNFRTFDPTTGQISPVESKMHEQPLPLIFSTADDQFAMGIYAPDQQPGGAQKASYGIFKFDRSEVVKWNCVYRDHDAAGLKKSRYAFNMFVTVGTVEDVRLAMAELVKEFAGK